MTISSHCEKFKWSAEESFGKENIPGKDKQGKLPKGHDPDESEDFKNQWCASHKNPLFCHNQSCDNVLGLSEKMTREVEMGL